MAGSLGVTVRFPHARGGVPVWMCLRCALISFSPRPWGCTVLFCHRGVRLGVFPTPVGVYRRSGRCRRRGVRFPHARGGVPRFFKWLTEEESFPHARGGVPRTTQPRGNGWSFPHARGGVPESWSETYQGLSFSPRPWGCTDSGQRSNSAPAVFPTPVGVYRIHGLYQKSILCFPHARGGVPLYHIW